MRLHRPGRSSGASRFVDELLARGTARRPHRALIHQIPETASITVNDCPDGGESQIAQPTFGQWRLIVRRTRPPGAQPGLSQNAQSNW